MDVLLLKGEPPNSIPTFHSRFIDMLPFSSQQCAMMHCCACDESQHATDGSLPVYEVAQRSHEPETEAGKTLC